MQKITIKDVAHEAGVSVATASNALNNPAIVRPRTRALVLAAAEKLAYVPNANGKRLRARQSNALGLFVNSMSGEYQFIADKMGMPMNTVKSICRRRGFLTYGPRKTKIEKQTARLCRNCLRPLNPERRMDSAYCSDHCRTAWSRKNRRVHEL